MADVIDSDGFRLNVGIVIVNDAGQVFWARRVRHDGWQFPQGGINSDETPLEAMYRELEEETGLAPEHVDVLGSTLGWLKYRLPRRYVRIGQRPRCIGQKQVWYLLHFRGEERHLQLDAGASPEFDSWRWVDFWYPARNVVDFKQDVYERALRQFVPLVEEACAVALANSSRDYTEPAL